MTNTFCRQFSARTPSRIRDFISTKQIASGSETLTGTIIPLTSSPATSEPSLKLPLGESLMCLSGEPRWNLPAFFSFLGLASPPLPGPRARMSEKLLAWDFFFSCRGVEVLDGSRWSFLQDSQRNQKGQHEEKNCFPVVGTQYR